jgi:hypothetical protein
VHLVGFIIRMYGNEYKNRRSGLLTVCVFLQMCHEICVRRQWGQSATRLVRTLCYPSITDTTITNQVAAHYVDTLSSVCDSMIYRTTQRIFLTYTFLATLRSCNYGNLSFFLIPPQKLPLKNSLTLKIYSSTSSGRQGNLTCTSLGLRLRQHCRFQHLFLIYTCCEAFVSYLHPVYVPLLRKKLPSIKH